MNVKYESTRKVVDRYVELARIPKHRPSDRLPNASRQHTTGDLLRLCESYSPEELALLLQNRHRTSSNNGILKTEALAKFAKVLHDNGIQTFQDLTIQSLATVEPLLMQIPGQRSGISIRYFAMLAGDDQQVKPDRMVVRFCSEAIGRSVSEGEAVALVRSASTELRSQYPHMSPRRLDVAIWNYQRIVDQTAKPSRPRKMTA